MSSDNIDRKRSVDVSQVSDEQLEQLIDQISVKIRNMVDETCEKANKMLNIYGLETKMEIVILRKDADK